MKQTIISKEQTLRNSKARILFEGSSTLTRYQSLKHPEFKDLKCETPFVFRVTGIITILLSIFTYQINTEQKMYGMALLAAPIALMGIALIVLGLRPDTQREYYNRVNRIIETQEPIKMTVASVEQVKYSQLVSYGGTSTRETVYRFLIRFTPLPSAENDSESSIKPEPALLDKKVYGVGFGKQNEKELAYVFLDHETNQIVAFETGNIMYWTRPDRPDFVLGKLLG